MMEVKAQEVDFNTLNLEVISIHQHLLNVERGNRQVTEILPKRIQYISGTQSPDLAATIKGLYNVIVLIFSELMESGEKEEMEKRPSSPHTVQVTLVPQKEKRGQYNVKNLKEGQLDYYQSYYSFNPNPILSLSKYTANDNNIRKEMQQFIKVVNNIQENTENFFREVLLSHQTKYTDTHLITTMIREKETNRDSLFKTIESKYQVLINYLKNLISKIEEERMEFDKSKEQLIEALFKQHVLKNTFKKPLGGRGNEKETQTHLTFNQLSKIEMQYEEQLIDIGQRDREKSAMMEELYHLKMESDTEKIKKESDQTILDQNAKIITNMQENILQICNYAADMEYSHIDINNKIDQLGTLGLEEYIDENQFSSFSMDFKVSLFNIFKKIVSKYAKANEDSKKQRESLGRRGGISEIRLSGTFANYRRASRRIEDVNPFMFIDKEENPGSGSSRNSQRRIQQSDGEARGKLNYNSKSPRINEINQSDAKQQQSDDDIINEKIVRSAKRGFVNSLMKKQSNIFPSQSPLNQPKNSQSHHELRESHRDISVAGSQEEPSKGKKKKTTVSNIKWRVEDNSNQELNHMINQKLTSKFEVVEKPIQEMNNEILNAPEKLLRKGKMRSHDSIVAHLPQKEKESVKKQLPETSATETLPSPNKANKRIKSILSKTSSWGFNKKVKTIMSKQAVINLEKQSQLEKGRVEEDNSKRSSRFSQFSALQNIQNLIDSNPDADGYQDNPRRSTVLKRISKISIEKNTSKRVTRLTKLTKVPTEITEQIFAEQGQDTPPKHSKENWLDGGSNPNTRYSSFGPHPTTFQSQHSDQDPKQTSPLTIMKNPQFKRVTRMYQQKQLSRQRQSESSGPNRLHQMQEQLLNKRQSSCGIGYFISKVSKQHLNLKSNRGFMNQLKLIFDMPVNEFNKTFKHNFNLESVMEMASSVHLKKCGSVFCTHLLRFYETIKRLAESKQSKEELVPSVHRISVIQKQEG